MKHAGRIPSMSSHRRNTPRILFACAAPELLPRLEAQDPFEGLCDRAFSRRV